MELDLQERRTRRSRAEMQDICDGLHAILAADHPMTVRQVFYQAVTKGLVDKTEQAYKTTVARLLVLMRRDGTLPYSWIADGTRWMRKPATYSGLDAFIERHQYAYRRDLWAESDGYVEIWVEKEALAGTIYDVTWEYDVPLMVSRGFASESYLYSAAEAIDGRCYDGDDPVRNAWIYYFGDYDPSGTKVDPAIERNIRRILVDEFNWPSTNGLHFERIAVTPAQIAGSETDGEPLPSRPTKIKDNAHAKGWRPDEESVELDALPAGTLRRLVRECIEEHIDQDQLARLRQIEDEEREQLVLFGQRLASNPIEPTDPLAPGG